MIQAVRDRPEHEDDQHTETDRRECYEQHFVDVIETGGDAFQVQAGKELQVYDTQCSQ